MGQLAMTAVGLAPLVEQGQDRSHLLLEQPVHRCAARRRVGQPALGSAVAPALRTPLGQLQYAARVA